MSEMHDGECKSALVLPPGSSDETGACDEILVVHSDPDSLKPLVEVMHGIGQRIVAASTPRDAVAILGNAAQRIRMAFVAPVVGASNARDIVKVILRSFPHVHCVLLTKLGTERLARAIRSELPHVGPAPWSLSRLREVIAAHELVMVASV